jgi:hypothetical protein
MIIMREIVQLSKFSFEVYVTFADFGYPVQRLFGFIAKTILNYLAFFRF